MFRIDVASAAAALPAPAAAGTGGYFSNGNPATSTPATVVDQDWLNSVQEELVAIAVSQGAPLNKSTRNQCLTAIQAMVATGASATAIQAQASNYATSVGGTANAITATFTPAIAAHIAGAPLRFKVATTNGAGGVTFKPDSASALALKALDGSAIAEGELLAGSIHTAIYDGAQYLCASLSRAFAVPGAVGLVVTNDATTPDSKIAVQCDSGVCIDSIGRAYPVKAINFTTAGTGAINLQTNGANGLDTGTFAGLANNWVHAYIIVKADGTKAGLASLSATAPVMPAGYIYALRCGAMRVNGTPALLRTKQLGRFARYIVAASSPTTLLPQMVAPVNSQSRTAIALGPFVPPTAIEVDVVTASESSANSWVLLAPNADVGYGATIDPTKPTQVYTSGHVSGQNIAQLTKLLLESTNIYYSSGSAAATHATVNCYGWTDKVLAA